MTTKSLMQDIAREADFHLATATLTNYGVHLLMRDGHASTIKIVSYDDIENMREPIDAVRSRLREMRAELEAFKDGVIIDVAPNIYDDIRGVLIKQGAAGQFNERGPSRMIRMTGITLRRSS